MIFMIRCLCSSSRLYPNFSCRYWCQNTNLLLPLLSHHHVHTVGHLHTQPQLVPLLLHPQAALARVVVLQLVGSLHLVVIKTDWLTDCDPLSALRTWLSWPNSFLMFTQHRSQLPTGPPDMWDMTKVTHPQHPHLTHLTALRIIFQQLQLILTLLQTSW